VTGVGGDEVDELLRLFAAKVAGGGDVVVALDPRAASLTLVRAGTEHRLHLPRHVLADGLADMERGEHPWEEGLPAQEALARLMTVHLDESFATRARHETGWWSYDGGFFEPWPPWEAPRRV
jgi:hypothetical protein